MLRVWFGLRFGAGVLAGMLLAAIILGVMIWSSWNAGIFNPWRSLFGSDESRIDVSQPTIVHQIRQLERLETVVYTLDKVVGGERDNRVLPKFLTGDRLLMIVHGEVIAGVDLGGIAPQDVVIRGRAISLRLPNVELFSTRVDNAKTRVFSRETGLLTRVDPNLETEVRREAERQVRAAALQDGILQVAERNARATLISLLRGFGFDKAEIHVAND